MGRGVRVGLAGKGKSEPRWGHVVGYFPRSGVQSVMTILACFLHLDCAVWLSCTFRRGFMRCCSVSVRIGGVLDWSAL